MEFEIAHYYFAVLLGIEKKDTAKIGCDGCFAEWETFWDYDEKS